MQTDDYKQKVLKHLLKDGKEISRERLIQAKEQADKLLEEIERLCSKGEAKRLHTIDSSHLKIQSNSLTKTAS
jgi:hypothetical protein